MLASSSMKSLNLSVLKIKRVEVSFAALSLCPKSVVSVCWSYWEPKIHFTVLMPVLVIRVPSPHHSSPSFLFIDRWVYPKSRWELVQDCVIVNYWEQVWRNHFFYQKLVRITKQIVRLNLISKFFGEGIRVNNFVIRHEKLQILVFKVQEDLNRLFKWNFCRIKI